MTTTQALESRIIEIIAEQTNVDVEAISLDSVFYEDIDLDSLELVEITMSLEEEFGIEVLDDDLASKPSVGDVVNLVQERLNNAS